MSISKIEWTDRTWNPVRGCSRVSEGCRNCYAERFAARYSFDGQAFHGFARFGASKREGGTITNRPEWTGRVELIPEKLSEPLRWKKPARVFVNSMSDLFHERLSIDAVAAVFGIMACAPMHTFQVLTKRPARMRAFFDRIQSEPRFAMSVGLSVAPANYPHALNFPAVWPLPNVWLGVSVEDQATADERIPLLLQTPAAVRFVSYEPALGPVDFDRLVIPGGTMAPLYGKGLDWVIVGGESGPGARPFAIEWARSTVRACRAADVPVFVKQLGAEVRIDGPSDHVHFAGAFDPEKQFFPRLRDRKGGDPAEWPSDLRVREFPR
ncbi:MAG TPA: phage Gp37/Gp68 family protein [Thermoanaerobaculia bacterium]|nr:phage Gp37/Gp68 family protein [Thermoanaerobaculia bacterium]